MPTYRVTFQRVGRHGGHGTPPPDPQTVDAVDDQDLVSQLVTIVRPYVLSSVYSVDLDVDSRCGYITCGLQTVGTFTAEVGKDTRGTGESTRPGTGHGGDRG